MKPLILSPAAAILSMLLAGCGDGTNINNMGVTAEESLALNETADMLDAFPDSLHAEVNTLLGNGEDPVAAMNEHDVLPATDNAAGERQ